MQTTTAPSNYSSALMKNSATNTSAHDENTNKKSKLSIHQSAKVQSVLSCKMQKNAND